MKLPMVSADGNTDNGWVGAVVGGPQIVEAVAWVGIRPAAAEPLF